MMEERHGREGELKMKMKLSKGDLILTSQNADDSFTLGQLLVGVKPCKATVTETTHELSIPVRALIVKCVPLNTMPNAGHEARRQQKQEGGSQ